MLFLNRIDAGRKLSERLSSLKNIKDIIVLGLPRGGVTTAAEIAKALNAPLDVIICRKIGAPENEEFAIGAISEAGGLFLNQELTAAFGTDRAYLDEAIARERKKIAFYQKEFRNGKSFPDLQNKTVVIADDGAATGMTIKAAIDAARKQNPKKIIVALPVAPPDTAKELRTLADETVILETPPRFQAVGQFYKDFRQVETGEVKKILITPPCLSTPILSRV